MQLPAIPSSLLSQKMTTNIQPKPRQSTIFDTLAPFLIGGASGALATCLIQPIDMFKVQIQVTSEKLGKLIPRPSLMNIFKEIKRQRGLKIFYTGLDSAIFRQLVYGSARLGSYNWTVQYCKDSNIPLNKLEKVLIATVSGAFGAIVGNPFDVALIRRQAFLSKNVDKDKMLFLQMFPFIRNENFKSLTVKTWKTCLQNLYNQLEKYFIFETIFPLQNIKQKNIFCRDPYELESFNKYNTDRKPAYREASLQEIMIGDFIYRIKQIQFGKMKIKFLTRTRYSNTGIQKTTKTAWILQDTADGTCIWRAVLQIDKIDVRNLLLFIYAKRGSNDQCPSTILNSGSHVDQYGRSSYQTGNQRLVDNRITQQMKHLVDDLIKCQQNISFESTYNQLHKIITKPNDSINIKLNASNANRKIYINHITTKSPPLYLHADHIIETNCFAGLPYLKALKQAAEKNIDADFSIQDLINLIKYQV